MIKNILVNSNKKYCYDCNNSQLPKISMCTKILYENSKCTNLLKIPGGECSGT